jgi:hypothetical protein
LFSGSDFCHLLELDDIFHCPVQRCVLFGDQLVRIVGAGDLSAHAASFGGSASPSRADLETQEAGVNTGLDLTKLSLVTEQLLIDARRPIVYVYLSNGRSLELTPSEAAAVDGLLPAFVMAADAIWQEAAGDGFGIELARDMKALAGWRLQSVKGSFSATLFAVMEAISQADNSQAIVGPELAVIWEETMRRVHQRDRDKGESPA